MRLNPALLATDTPPIPEARRWLEGARFPTDRPLLNVSQAAPTNPPVEALRAHIADLAINDPEAHLYGPVLGLPDLRDEVARTWTREYGGTVSAHEVAITAGCNQAFVAAITALAGHGDEFLLPTPWYFNHKMALDMAGISAVPLPCGPDLVPDAEAARHLLTPKTRAVVLVTPNNPTGVEYPSETLSEFRDLCRVQEIALLVDETYRDFHARTGPPHDLFTDPDWSDTVISLYSFSKAYRLTGHRVGAMIASERVLREIEKVQDTHIIGANQIGQRAALWGMRNLRQWLAGERDEILTRRAAVETAFSQLEGWSLRGLGAYFAFVTHPFDETSDAVARRLVDEAGVLALPATMFAPESDPIRHSALRIAFANIDSVQIAELAKRLDALAR
ncbi:MAG: aminotransferase [Paracoccaceae bacterium]|nr:aminotransferase [Paracoccaceae bacterium]